MAIRGDGWIFERASALLNVTSRERVVLSSQVSALFAQDKRRLIYHTLGLPRWRPAL